MTVNRVTPTLFARYPDAITMAGAERADLEEILKPTGFFRAKANSVLGLATALVERFDGEVPGRMADRSEEHTSELQSRRDLVCRLLLEKKKGAREDAACVAAAGAARRRGRGRPGAG